MIYRRNSELCKEIILIRICRLNLFNIFLRLLNCKLCKKIIFYLIIFRSGRLFFFRHINRKSCEVVINSNACSRNSSCRLMNLFFNLYRLSFTNLRLIYNRSCCRFCLFKLFLRSSCDFCNCISKVNNALVTYTHFLTLSFFFKQTGHFFFIGSDNFLCNGSLTFFTGNFLEVGHFCTPAIPCDTFCPQQIYSASGSFVVIGTMNLITIRRCYKCDIHNKLHYCSAHRCSCRFTAAACRFPKVREYSKKCSHWVKYN